MIDRLRVWILEKRYVQAVKIVRSVNVNERTRWLNFETGETDSRGRPKFHDHDYTGDTKVERFVYSTTRKFRACDESICDLDADPGTSYCAEICVNIPQDGQNYVERDVINLVEISTKTVFDHRICRERG